MAYRWPVSGGVQREVSVTLRSRRSSDRAECHEAPSSWAVSGILEITRLAVIVVAVSLRLVPPRLFTSGCCFLRKTITQGPRDLSGRATGDPGRPTPWIADIADASRGRSPTTRSTCVELLIVSLLQEGGSRATSLGHPAYPRPKGTGDQSMPEKRRQAKSASRTLRKTRVAWSRLDCLKSNPDRDTRSPVASDWTHEREVIVCSLPSGQWDTASPRDEIPGDDTRA